MRHSVALYVHCPSSFCVYVCVDYGPLKKIGQIGARKRRVEIATTRCVIKQKSAFLICFVAEA
jgi:hypothetical protein